MKVITMKFYCHKCLTTFQIVVAHPDGFTRWCVECGTTDRKSIQYIGRATMSTYEVTYTWSVLAYNHDEAKDKAKRLGFGDAVGMGTRIVSDG